MKEHKNSRRVQFCEKSVVSRKHFGWKHILQFTKDLHSSVKDENRGSCVLPSRTQIIQMNGSHQCTSKSTYKALALDVHSNLISKTSLVSSHAGFPDYSNVHDRKCLYKVSVNNKHVIVFSYPTSAHSSTSSQGFHHPAELSSVLTDVNKTFSLRHDSCCTFS